MTNGAKSKPPDLWQRLRPSAAAAIRRVTFKGVATAVIVVPVTLYVVKESFADAVTIDPFEVPKQLADLGYTPTVMASRIGEAVNRIERDVQTRMSKDKPAVYASEDLPLNIEVPGTSIGLQTVISVARTVLGRTPTHVGGSIATRVEGSIPPDTGKLPMVVTVYVTGKQQRTREASEAIASGVDAIAKAAAEQALARINPYLLAVYLEQHHRYEGAINLVERQVNDPTTDPAHREAAYLLWGVALVDQANYDKAIIQYQHALDLNPSDAAVYNNWGTLLVAENKLDEAIAKYKKAIEIDPRSAFAFASWGAALEKKGATNDAVQKYSEAVRLNPQLSAAYDNWGMLLAKQKRYPEAEAQFKRAIAVTPGRAATRIYWARMLADQGRLDEADTQFEKAVAADPMSSSAYYDWGGLMLQLKLYDAAVEKYRAAISLYPDSADAHINLAFCYLLQDRFELALSESRTASDIDSTKAYAYGNWGAALVGLGHNDEAIQRSTKAIELDPKDWFAYVNWGKALTALGKYQEADNIFSKAVAIDAQQAVTYRSIGNLYSKQRRFPEAISMYRKALEVDASDVASLDGWEASLLAQGARADAATVRARRDLVVEKAINAARALSRHLKERADGVL